MVKMDFMSLPLVMIENIFSYLTYDEIAKNRLVSKSFNEICSRMLNRGFMMIERRHAVALKNVKAQLPRRESERRPPCWQTLLRPSSIVSRSSRDSATTKMSSANRRYHQLSRHCDILTSIETRISMLNMTYAKFVDHGLCCFIPGKVIDEIQRVLSVVERSTAPPRAHEVLQELRDISSMAIEHFDDKVSPALRRRLAHAAPATARPATGALASIALKQEMAHLRRRSILNAKLSLCLAAQYKKFFKKMTDYKKVARRQHAVIRQMLRRQRDQDLTIADLKKRIEECDIKYSELTHTSQAAGGKASAGGEAVSAPTRHFSSQIKLDLSVLPIGTNKRPAAGQLLSNIKPRTPVIKLPSAAEEDGEPPLKVSRVEEPPTTSKPPTTLSKIRGITNEIRLLSNLNLKNKRPHSDVEGPDCKRQKLD